MGIMEPEQPPHQSSLTGSSLPEDEQPHTLSSQPLSSVQPPVSPPQAASSDKKPIPDQATIDALLQVTREEYERKQRGDGRTIRHWWNPAEWIGSTPEMRRSGLIKAAIAIVTTIVLTIVTDKLTAHSGIKL
jgi:hypothetical protein